MTDNLPPRKHYLGIAIIHALGYVNSQDFYFDQILELFVKPGDDKLAHSGIFVFSTDYETTNTLLKEGMEYLAEVRIIRKHNDPYGPDLYSYSHEDYTFFTASPNIPPVYRRFEKHGWDWLQIALSNIANEHDSSIVNSKTTTEEQDWHPLPIDRQNPDYSQTIETTEEALKIIEGDNGYAHLLSPKNEMQWFTPYVAPSMRLKTALPA